MINFSDKQLYLFDIIKTLNSKDYFILKPNTYEIIEGVKDPEEEEND